jgi:hypothetical protein
MTPVYPGSSLTAEPFRWDQKLFAIQMRMQGMSPMLQADEYTELGIGFTKAPTIAPMCEVTGGAAFRVYEAKQMQKALETIALRVQHPAVVLNFVPNTTSNTPISTPNGETKYISPPNVEACTVFVMPNMQGLWPVPEEFLINSSITSLPPRRAHPSITYKTTPTSISLTENFPVDCYQLESGPLASFVIKTTVAGKNGLCLTINGSTPVRYRIPSIHLHYLGTPSIWVSVVRNTPRACPSLPLPTPL